MQLIEKVQELQAIQPPLETDEINRRIQEWKKQTNYEAPEKVKSTGAAKQTDANASPKETPEASESLGSGNGQLEYQDDYGLKLQPIKGLGNKTNGFGTSEFFKDVIYNMQLDEYETKINEYNKLKKSQQQGINLIESGEVGYESRVIIPRGETGFDEFTFSQIQEKIDNKAKGFENVKDIKDYVNKVPGAEIVNYTENLDFEGAVGTLDEVIIQKYDPEELNIELGNKAWETNNEPAIQASLDKYGSSVGSSYFPTIKSAREAEKEKNDGSKAVNISNVQNYRTNYLGSQANLQFNDVSIDDVLQDGKQFLTKNELKFLELSPEEQDKEASKENYGERLFFGDEIKNLDLDKVQESEIELFQKAKKLADTTEKDVLKQKLNNDYFKIVGLAQEIYNWDKQSSGTANDPIYFSKNGGYQGKKGFEWAENISSLVEEIATNGRLPGYLEELDARAISDEDGHPLIKAFNNAVKEYKIVNRAYQLDRDPLTTEKGGFGEEFVSATLKLLGGTPDSTDREKKNTYLNWAQANGFTASKSALDNSLAIQIPGVGLQAPESFGQEIGATAPDLLAWMGDVYLFTRGSGNIVGKTQKWANKLATQSKRFSKIPYALPAFKTATAALGQAVTFTGGNIVSQYRTGEFSLEELPSSAGFGASLALGHSMYDPFVKFLGTSKVGRLFSPVVNALTKYAPNTYKRVSRSVGSGFGGATTYQFGGVVTGGLFDEQGNLTVSLHTQAAETIKMIIAGTFTKAIPNMRSIGKEFKSDIISAKTSGRLDLQSRKSAKSLGVDEKNIKEATTDAVDELNKAFDNKVENLLKRKREGKINKEEADTEFKKLKEDYRVVDTQITVNAAYELIQAEKNSGNAPKESEFYVVSQKIKNGEKLNARDGEVLSYYGLDGVGMLYKKLGIQKNSVNDSYLQNLILNESLIDAQLNGKSFMLTPYGLQPLNPTEFVAPKGTSARKNAREFLLKKQELNEKIYRLKNLDKTNLSESELLENKQAIRDAEQELSQYVKGGKAYNEIQSQLSGASIKAYEKDVAQTDISEGEVIEAKTPEEFQKIYDESGFKAEDVKGRIAFTDKDGNKIINREFALEQRNFTPVTHEIPHSILKDSFKNDQGNVTPEGIKMIDGVLENLTPRQKKVLDEELLSRYEIGESKEKWYEENITVLSELIKRGEIQFNKSFGEGLAGLVPAFKNFLPNIEVNPNTGKGIFDMLKAQDLGRVTIEKDQAKEKIAQQGELAPAFSLAKKDSDTVNKLFEEKGKDGSFEMLELLRPTAVALARRFRNRPNYDEQLLVDEIMTGKRGMLDVINDYAAKVEKGDKVGELSLFLNNSFSTKTGFKRYIEIADRNLGKEFDQSIDDLAGLKEAPAAEATKEAPVEKIAKKPTETTRFEKTRLTPEFLESITVEKGQSQKDAIENKITEVVKESYKDKGPITKYKDLGKTPKALAQLYADMFGLKTVDALIEKARNIPKFDNDALVKIRQFLVDNAASDFARLPKGKDAVGKATGILQTTIGKALYNKEGKLTGTLKNYIDIIKGKNVTINGVEFNKIVDGKKLPLYRDAQHYKAAIKAHIDNRVLETLVESPGERAKLGAKFSGAKKPLTVKQIEEAAKRKIGVDVKGKPLFRPKNIKQTRSEKYGIFGLTYENPRDKGKTYSTRDLEKPLPKELQAVEGESVKDGVIRVTNEFLNSNPEYYNAIRDSVTAGVERGLLSTKEVFGTVVDSKKFKDVKQKGNRFPYLGKGGFLKPSFVKTFTGKDYIKSQEAQLDSFIDFFKGVEKYLTKNSQDAWYFDALVKDAQDNQNSIFRYSAPILFLNVSKNGKYPLNVAMREEHSTPQNRIGTMLLDAAIKGNVNQVSRLVKAIYMQGGVTRVDDALLDVDYKFGMPDFFWENVAPRIMSGELKLNNGLGAIIRMTEAGVNLDNYQYIVANKTFSEYFFGKKGLQQSVQAELIRDYFSGKKTAEQIKEYAKFEDKLSEPKIKEAEISNNLQPNNIKLKGESSKNGVQVVNELGNLDNALNTGRVAPFSAPKKIRIFDFDDTLAKSKSKVLYTTPNVEGGFSEGATNLKAIFMVGGPGAGKTNVGKGLQLGRRGYKVVNQDIALESMKAEAGLPAKESDYTAEQRSTRSKLGAAARKAAVAKFDKYAAAGNGMVIDGTGASYNATTKKIKALEDKGYEVHMVVATTPLETAVARNKARAERSLPDFVVKKTYESVQESLKKYRKDFGGRLYEINTETIEYGKPLPTEFLKQVYAGINTNKVGKINATEFAEQASTLEKLGAEFDFREFNKVVEGEKGPLFGVAEKIAAARGTDDLFILTARPQDAAGPIQEFMKANGIDIPLANITGLGDGTAAAKGRWIAGKAAEGYNDFYFADDAIKNVEAVKDVLSQVDVKSKVQQAKFSKAKNFDKIFNNIIEAKTGIESYKQYSAAKAKTVGANKGKFGFFIPASAEDFTGLLYRTLGKGKVGDAQMAFYKENLLDPYNRAEMAISQAKVAAGRDYKELKRQFKSIPKTLEKETGISKFKYQHAIRTYIWDKQGLEVPGLSKRDQKRLVDFVSNDAELSVFADNLITIQKGKPYPEPNKDWTAGTITTDVIGGINKINRAEYLKEWQENVDIIFSDKNINKLEAAFGPRYVEALKNSLAAMKSGSNRPLGGDRISNRILDWTNNSIGAVMFLNTRSAVLQTISSVNFINWGDNNLYAAGKAFGNQKQYWKDFLTLMNSDYLLERRDGLKINVSESEIADAVENSKNKATAAISFLLNKGFVFTRYADSFAIASGGATFYRNRIKSLMKEGMSQELAEQQAFEDFRLIAEENQQSSSPMRISQQQRSTIGRMVLAFGNTQMQYARIQKRAIQDLVNKRGDWKSNISKIVYYGGIQNLMFNGLQSALGWSLFDDDDDEKAKAKRTERKLQRTLNGMIDSQLKGLGIAGAVTSGVKNALMTIAEQQGKKSPKFEEAIDDLINVMPAIGSKVRKLKSAARTTSWNRKEIKAKGFSLDNPAYLAGAQVVSGVTNIPVDEAAMKINTMRNILNPYTEAWQKVALALGWSTWDVDLPYWGLAEEKPVLTETEKQTKKLFDLNKSDQVKMLLDLGLTKKQIRALTKEEQRVQEIIKLQNKKKDGKDKS
jgi:predicted kinase